MVESLYLYASEVQKCCILELVWWNPNSFLSIPTCLLTPFHLKLHWTISRSLNICPTPTPSSICLSLWWCGSSTPWLFCLEPFLPICHTLLIFTLHNSLQASNFSGIFCNCFSNPILITYVVLGASSVVPHSLSICASSLSLVRWILLCLQDYMFLIVRESHIFPCWFINFHANAWHTTSKIYGSTNASLYTS